MDNKEKARIISPGVDPDERVTVDFDDERDLNAEVTGCTPRFSISILRARILRTSTTI